jgi:hypothetical protein
MMIRSKLLAAIRTYVPVTAGILGIMRKTALLATLHTVW